jgi:hypothetical protein
MNDLYKQLRSDYINALRSITPEILHWWSDNCRYHWTDEVPNEEMTDFHRRWPFGPAAHPRIIHLFRKYYFAVWELNDRLAAEEKKQEEDTGIRPETISMQRPQDLLVNDLSTAAPDLFEIMQGFLYIPIGMTLSGEEC